MDLGDITDYITDGFWYLLSFEWVGDIWEGITGLFSSLGEFSYAGLTFGALATFLVYVLREKMLYPFLSYMNKPEALFWGAMTYLGTLVVGYLAGKKLFEE